MKVEIETKRMGTDGKPLKRKIKEDEEDEEDDEEDEPEESEEDDESE